MASSSSDILVMQPNVPGESSEGMELDVYKAAKEGNIEALSRHGQPLHQILTPTRNTVLHIYIACATSAHIVQRMLQICPELLAQSNKIGDTALHTAARYGRSHIVNMIMQEAKSGPDGGPWRRIIVTTNEEGNTALHEAVRFNHIEVVTILITEHDHQIQRVFNYANHAKETPLYMAVERGYRDLFEIILENCTDPAYLGPNRRSALHAAVIRKDEDMTKRLLGLTKVVDDQGCTPLHIAASLGLTSIVENLLQHDRSAAYVRDKDKKMTALHYAAFEGHVDVMKQIIFHCPDSCELVDEKGRNVLHYSINVENDHVVDFVLEDPWLSNILLNGKDDNGNTPLHHHVDISTVPFSFGLETDARVDKMAFNKENQNAFDIILQNDGDFYSSSTQGKLKEKLKRNGAMPGRRIVRNKEEVEAIVEKKASDYQYNEIRDSHLVVATLIATVSFTAGFTMPGGYQGDKGSDQGFAILTRNAAFQAFVITNTIAMTLSSCSVLLHLYSIWFLKRKVMSEASSFLYGCTMLALIAMVIAFITGTYAVLSHSSRLGITVCVLGCSLFFGIVELVVYEERGIMRSGPKLVPLTVPVFIFFWLMGRIFDVINKLFYRCISLVAPTSKGKWSKPMVASSRSSSIPRRGTDRQMIVQDRC